MRNIVFFIIAIIFSLKSLGQNKRIVSVKESPIFWHSIDSYINNPVCFVDITRVFSLPDTNSIVLGILKPKEHLELLCEGEKNGELQFEYIKENGSVSYGTKYTIFKWYEINYRSNNGLVKAYIKASDIAETSFNGKNNLYVLKKCDSALCVIVYKYDNLKKQFIDSLKIDFAYDITAIKNIGGIEWKNVDVIFRISSLGAYCGGGEENKIIVSTKDSLFLLTRSGFENNEDTEDFSSSKVYLPRKLDNGKTLLVENGDLENIFNVYNGTLNVFNCPHKFNFPKQELVALKKSFQINDSTKHQNKTGNVGMKTKSIFKLFRWNGRTLAYLMTL